MLLLLFAQDKSILKRSAEMRKLWPAGAMSEIFAQDSNMLPNIGHFGYRDGFSQPTIDGGLPIPVPDILPKAPAESFCWGMKSQFEQFTYRVPEPQELGL